MTLLMLFAGWFLAGWFYLDCEALKRELEFARLEIDWLKSERARRSSGCRITR